MSENLYLRNGIYWGRTEVAGREYRRSLRTRSRPIAAKRRTAWIERLKAAAHFGEERRNWKEAVVRWLAEVAPTTLKAGTLKRYQVSLRQLDPFLGNLRLEEISRRTFAAMIATRAKAGASNATIRRDMTAASSVLSACVVWEWCAANSARDFDRRIIRERREPIILPADEHIAMVLARCPPMFGRLVLALRQTGMRQEEGAGLERPQLDLKRRQITLTRTKTSRPRVVPLSDEAVGTFSGTPEYLNSPYVFWHDEGDRFANVASRFAQITKAVEIEAEKAGKPFRRFTCHHLRHRFAVDFLKAGGSIYDCQQILGHKSIRTTEIYLDYLSPDEKVAAKRSAQESAQLKRFA